MDDAGHRVAANPCGSHPDRREQPDDIAGAVAFLAGPDSDFVSGSMLVVDGGFSRR